MRYLYRPSAMEELLVRGRYEVTAPDGTLLAAERWERYRNEGSPVQTWRSEWVGEWRGRRDTLLAHAVVSPDGLERLKLRHLGDEGGSQQLTLTFDQDNVLVQEDGAYEELALPPGYGLVAPLVSLARFAFPFDLASEQKELAMTLLLRQRAAEGHVTARLTKFGYVPVGYEEIELRGERLKLRGWRMEVPGLPPQEGWFERNGTCLIWRVHGEQPREARLVEWMRFG